MAPRVRTSFLVLILVALPALVFAIQTEIRAIHGGNARSWVQWWGLHSSLRQQSLSLSRRSVVINFSISLWNLFRERKIPDLSQADTSHYQVHKIQPITKHYVLLLEFAITTQKPTEICQVSCKNQSHLSTCKRWHKQPRTCKRWHKQPRTCKRWHKRTNQAMTCVTNQTPPRVTHQPQTPINRNLPKTFWKRLGRG